jgi:hypothetical protein
MLSALIFNIKKNLYTSWDADLMRSTANPLPFPSHRLTL